MQPSSRYYTRKSRRHRGLISGHSLPVQGAIALSVAGASRGTSAWGGRTGQCLALPTTPSLVMDRIAQLESFLDDDPDDAFTQFALAQEHLKQGDLNTAQEYFETLVAEQPDYVGTYYHLGKLYERRGAVEQAIETYEQGIEVARTQRDRKNLSELQDALMQAKGVGF